MRGFSPPRCIHSFMHSHSFNLPFGRREIVLLRVRDRDREGAWIWSKWIAAGAVLRVTGSIKKFHINFSKILYHLVMIARIKCTRYFWYVFLFESKRVESGIRKSNQNHMTTVHNYTARIHTHGCAHSHVHTNTHAHVQPCKHLANHHNPCLARVIYRVIFVRLQSNQATWESKWK